MADDRAGPPSPLIGCLLISYQSSVSRRFSMPLRGFVAESVSPINARTEAIDVI